MKKCVAVVGLGKIGLPLAAQFATKGHKVIGCDLSDEVVSLVNQGMTTFQGEPGLQERISKACQLGLLSATTHTTEAVMESEVVVIVVPLLVDESGAPLFESLESATRDVGRGLRKGTLVCFETTVPVGSTRKRLTPILEKESGLEAGKDFFVAFSPERVYSGRIFENLGQYPKLVGGINNASALAAEDFYNSAISFDKRLDLKRANGVWNLGSTEASELAKLAETTYRDVNIALANQFAQFAESIGTDVYEVIDACNSQPFSHIHQPGISVGGHCIPVYPHMYLLGHPEASVVESARKANDSMPRHVVDRIESELGDLSGLSVAILGVSYRGGVKEHAFSGTFSLVEALMIRQAKVYVVDPMYSESELKALGLQPLHNPDAIDIVILHTNHEEFLQLSQDSFSNCRLFFDGRNFARSAFAGGHASFAVIGQDTKSTIGPIA